MTDHSTLHLSKDPIMKGIIRKLGPLEEYERSSDLFTSLVREIVYQQLSGKAADTIYQRFENVLSKKNILDPQEILSIKHETLRGAGMSNAKARYVKHLAEAAIGGSLSMEKLESLTDEEIIIELTKIKGVGVWTAEMSLMFHFRRPDIFSIGDVGLRNAVSKHYLVDRDDTKKILTISRPWSPYRTFASRYLWKSIA